MPSGTTTGDLSALPAGTSVVALDSSGQSVPLGTQQAANIIANGDPMWCPAGTTTYSAASCVNSTTVAGLITLLNSSLKTGAGVIYFTSTYATNDVTFNGSALPKLTDLTLQGGWDGITTGTIHLSGATTFSVPVNISSWNNGNVTLNDIIITGLSSTSPGLSVTTNKNIVLNRVNAHNNTGLNERGAVLDNSTGTGTITINSSTFSNNSLDGLELYSKGLVTLNSVTAIGSVGGYGVYLINNTSAAAMVINSSDLESNWLGNLLISSGGAVTLNNLTSKSSGSGNGATIDNTLGTAGVTVSGGDYESNKGDSLHIVSRGVVTLNNVFEAGTPSSGYGAYVNNSTGTGAVSVNGGIYKNNNLDNLNITSSGAITLTNVVSTGSNNNGATLNNSGAAVAAPVTVTGNNLFNVTAGQFNNTFAQNANSGPEAGLSVLSKGTITLTDIYAFRNGGYGAILDNHTGTASVVLTTTSGATNAFYGNGSEGLKIVTSGAVSSTNLFANSNGFNYGSTYGGGGVEIDNHTAATNQPVSLLGSNQYQYNSTFGLSVISKGLVTLNAVIADHNTGPYSTNPNFGGVYINNTAGTGGVTLTGINELNYNSGHGLMVLSNGAVSLTSITANNNGQSGHGYGLYVDNTGASTPLAVTVAGTNDFESDNQGVWIHSKGAITVNNLTAQSDSSGASIGIPEDGVTLNNVGGVGGISLTGTNLMRYNYYGYGLKITSYGAITLNNVTSQSNGLFTSAGFGYGYGVYLDNSSSPLLTHPGVTLTGTNSIGGNGLTGLYIRTAGAVSINNLGANSNGQQSHNGSGLDVDNTLGTAGVTLTGTNNFAQNYTNNALVVTNGAITINNLTASGSNMGAGANLNNSTASTPQNVTITGTNDFESNNTYGLVVHTLGTITLNSLSATGSGQDGVHLDNSGGTLKAVTLTGSNVFGSNTGDGLYVNSSGALTINSMSANWNSNYGAELYAVGTIMLTGTNNVYQNTHNTGLLAVSSAGAIKINALTDYSNGDAAGEYGLQLNNSAAGPLQPIVFTGVNSITSNYDSGLYIKTAGAITINALTSNYNGTGLSTHGFGVEIDGSADPASFVLTGTNAFSNNYSGGLWITGKGPITLSNVTADNNFYGDGVYLNNTDSTTGSPQNVTITGTNYFDSNPRGAGLEVHTYGAIALNNIEADNNGSIVSTNGYGALLDNSGGTLKNITLTGANTFASDAQDGLKVVSTGAIAINELTANSNSGMGAELASIGNVSLTGSNDIESNTLTGISIDTLGAISLNSMYVISNGSGSSNYGISLDNHLGAAQPITFTGTTYVDNNRYDTNIYILSAGLVTFANLTSTSSGSTSGSGYGLFINNTYGTAGVKLLGLANTLNYDRSGGLWVQTNGPITLNNITADYNYGPGAQLFNNYDSAHPQDVTITGTNSFSNNNLGAAASGLTIQTYGAIVLNNVTAGGNSVAGSYGAILNNASGTVTAKPVTLTGVNEFDYNNLDGLNITSLGAITIASLTAISNAAGNGAVLNNTGGTSGVTVSIKAQMNYNHLGGLLITTPGAISLANLDVEGNGSSNGATLNNSSGTAGVTLTGSQFAESNHQNGISITTHGAVTISNLTAQYNGYSGGGTYGAVIDNASGTSVAQPVSLLGTNSTSSNVDGGGLLITSLGAITIQNLTASSNTGSGAMLSNTGGTAGVTISGTNVFNSNTGSGLTISSKGAVLMNNLTANNNSGSSIGVDVNTTTGTAASVTLTGSGVFNNNGSTGLRIQASGAITLTNLTANQDWTGGVLLSNSTGSGAITLTGLNTFLYNYNTAGLIIHGAGAVSITKIRSDGNAGDGLTITTAAPAAVTVTCGYLTENGAYGVNISDPNPSLVTLIGVLSGGNTTADYNPLTGMNRVGSCTMP